MTEDDDSTWLSALGGRAAAGDSAAAREADALRASILTRELPEGPAVPERDPAREEQLIERARRAGLVPRRSWAWIGSWTGLRSALAVAALACVAVAVGLWMRPADEPEVVRGSSEAIVRIEAADPVARQRQIVDDLRAVGVEATVYERLGRAGIDADLPAPIPDDVRRVLERHRIPVPADGVLRVEIAAPVAE